MKKFLMFLLTGFILNLAAQAQVKTVTISTPTVQCGMCKERIEEVMKRYDGITSIIVNVKKKTTVVKYIPDRTNEENIKAGIANAGYDANEVAANPDVYKTLPKCCKKKE